MNPRSDGTDNTIPQPGEPTGKDKFDPDDMPDCFIPDNFDEYLRSVAEHGTKKGRKRDGTVREAHHIYAGMTLDEYLQGAVNVVTAPGAIIDRVQNGGRTRFYTGCYNGKHFAAIIPEKIIPGKRDATFFQIEHNTPGKIYLQRSLDSNWTERPRILYDSGLGLRLSEKALNAHRSAQLISEIVSAVEEHHTVFESRSAASTIASEPTHRPNDVESHAITDTTSVPSGPSTQTAASLASPDNTANATQFSDIGLNGSSSDVEGSGKDRSVDTITAGDDGCAEHHSSPAVRTAIDVNSVAKNALLNPNDETGFEVQSMDDVDDHVINLDASIDETPAESSDLVFNVSEADDIDVTQMGTPHTSEFSETCEDAVGAADQPSAVDALLVERAESGDEVDADGDDDTALAAAEPSTEEDESPSALDVVAYEAVESGEISLDGVLAEDDVGTEDVASEEDNGELGPDFLSGDESAAVDQVAVAESVDGAQDALSDAEMDDGDDVGVESEAGADGELRAEADASDILSSDLSLESTEETAEADDGSLDVEEQEAVEDVAALEDAASVEDDGDIDLDAALSAEPATEDQMGAVDGNDDGLDFASEAEVAELEASPSDSDAALDDDFLSLGEHDDMTVQESPSALDDTTDLQDDFLDADDTSSVDSVDDDFLSMDDLAVDEEDLPDSAVDAGDELGFDEPADVGLDADNDGLDIDTDATDIDADDIDADDDDDVSESGGFSL